MRCRKRAASLELGFLKWLHLVGFWPGAGGWCYVVLTVCWLTLFIYTNPPGGPGGLVLGLRVANRYYCMGESAD